MDTTENTTTVSPHDTQSPPSATESNGVVDEGRAPSPNGRGPDGRFGRGNTFSRGNPHARKVGSLRSAILMALDADTVSRIVAKLVAKAEAGDLAAARFVLRTCLGSPPVEPDGDPKPPVPAPPNAARAIPADRGRRCLSIRVAATLAQ
jgi:hypothetical protein